MTKFRPLQRALVLTTAFLCVTLAAAGYAQGQAEGSSDLAKRLGVRFPPGNSAVVLLEQNGKQYRIDTAAKTVAEVERAAAAAQGGGDSNAPAIFSKNCAICHGPNGSGNKAVGTPNFHDPPFQKSRSEADLSHSIHNGKGSIMPAWSGKLSETDISELVRYVRSFGVQGGSSSSSPVAAGGTSPAATATPEKPNIYEAGDDMLISLPTGRPKNKGGMWVNFTHRFAYDPSFSGTGRGEVLFGLDGYALPSLGFTYGITDRLSASIYRSPTVIGRPIQLMTAYNILDEHKQSPLNLTMRVSIEGQNNFRKSYTENIEGIISRSITSRAQFYVVPTASFNARMLAQGGFRSSEIPDLPGVNTFALGAGLAVDVRPTVALLAEIIPTLVNGDQLGIHRPAWSFGIQKKIYRHAFTLGFTTSPGTTVSQRAGTRAAFVGNPSADTPSGLTIGFDLMRQIR